MGEETLRLVIGIGSALVASLVTLAGAYVLVSTKLAFIQGQLTQLMEIHKTVGKVRDKVVAVAAAQDKMKVDLDQAHVRIRGLHTKLNTNGSGHG